MTKGTRITTNRDLTRRPLADPHSRDDAAGSKLMMMDLNLRVASGLYLVPMLTTAFIKLYHLRKLGISMGGYDEVPRVLFVLFLVWHLENTSTHTTIANFDHTTVSIDPPPSSARHEHC